MRLAVIAGISILSAISVVAALGMLAAELRGHPTPAGPGSSNRPRSEGRTAGTPVVTSSVWKPQALAGTGGLRVLVAVVLGAVVGWVTRWPVAGLACGAAVLAWPAFTSGRRSEQREIAVLEAVVVWTQGLRDTVSGGASLEQAIGVSVEGAPSALLPSLEQVRSRMLVRHPLDEALAPLREVPGADFVTAALMLAARRRGDRLPDVLSGIVDTCAQEVAQRRQIVAVRAGIHRSVQIIVVVTVMILVWMATVGAAYMAPYDSVTGQGVLSLVIVIIGTGFIWLARLDSTVTGERFFTPALDAGADRIVTHLAQPPEMRAERPSGPATSGAGFSAPASRRPSTAAAGPARDRGQRSWS